MMKKTTLTILIFLVSATTIFAQEKPAKECPQLKKMNEELKQYFDTKMYPTIKSAHDQLMTKVSDEDKIQLEKLSKTYQAALKERKAFEKEAAKAKKEGKDMKKWKTANKAKRQKFMLKIRKVNIKLQPIYSKYQSEILANQDKLEAENQNWQEARFKIVDKYERFDCVKIARSDPSKVKKGATLEPKKNKELKKRIDKGEGQRGKAAQGMPEHPTARLRRSSSFLLWNSDLKEMPQNLDNTENYKRKPPTSQH